MNPKQKQKTDWKNVAIGVLWMLSSLIAFGLFTLLNALFNQIESQGTVFLNVFLFLGILFLIPAGLIIGARKIVRGNQKFPTNNTVSQPRNIDKILKSIVLFCIFSWLVVISLALYIGNSPAGLALLPLIIVLPVITTVGAVSLVILAFRNKNQNPHKRILYRLIALILGVIIFGAITYPWIKDYRYNASGQAERDRQKNYARINEEYRNKVTQITFDQATEILNSCKLKGFYYTNQRRLDVPPENKFNPFLRVEESSTGIVLLSRAKNNQPINLHIADRHIATMVPIARNAQKKCVDLQFWHDGNYEQKQPDGSWR